MKQLRITNYELHHLICSYVPNVVKFNYRLLLFTLFLFVSLNLTAQKPKAVFFSDSIEIGSEIKLSMTYLHSGSSDIVFPDSSYDFSPFQYVSTEYFETQTVNGKSLDSVIYTLVTFEWERDLSIAPFVKNLNTGQRIYADTATVMLKSLVNPFSKNPLQTKDVYTVKKEFNVPKLTYFFLSLLIIGLFIFLLFGEWIKRRYYLWKYDQHYQSFVDGFKKKSQNPREIKNIQTALTDWKIYMEWLTKTPVSTMSTSEIEELYENERLESALKMFDTAIFGNVVSDQIPFAFHILQDFALKKYRDERKSKI
jgi:hypothetical protein